MEETAMTIMRFDPLREFDRLTDQLLASTRALRAIPMEAYRRGDQFFVHLDLPGVKEDDVDLTVEGNMVNVRAERRSPREEGDEVVVDERPQGTFARQLLLGENLDVGGLSAAYDHGVLMIRIPVSKAAQPRRVQIQPEAEARRVEPQRGGEGTTSESGMSGAPADTTPEGTAQPGDTTPPGAAGERPLR
jgi:HSP20 family protein